MKNAILFLFLTLWAPLAIGQIVLPRSAAVSKLPVGLQQSKLVHEFFTQERAPLLSASSVTTDEDLQLDSAVVMMASDAGGGNVIVAPLSKKTYQYPSSWIVIETESNREDGKWVPSARSQQRFDDEGRLFAVIAENYNLEFGFWSPDSRFIIYYHGNSETLADSMFVESWSQDLNNWVRVLAVYNTFNNLELVFESYSTISLDEFGELTFKDIYHYDDFANNILIESFLLEEEDIIPSGREENDFVFNYLISTTTSSADGLGGFIPENKITYTYTGRGVADSISTYQYVQIADTWSLTEGNYYEFDEAYRVSKQVQIIAELESTIEQRIVTYQYFHDDYLESENSYYVDVESGVQYLDQRILYYYSTFSTSVPIPSEFEILTISPNPTQHLVELSVSDATSMRIFDIRGKLVGTQPVSPGRNQMDLAELQPGMYTLVLQDKQRVYSGKVVKL